MYSMKEIKYHANLVADSSCYLGDYRVVNISQGSRGESCLLAVNDVPKRERDMFVQSKTPTLHDYKIVIIAENYTQKIIIPEQAWNYHFVQPIDTGNILLACARTRNYKDGSFDKNGKVYNCQGKLKREFLLGDGIQDVKVTSQNSIWTSYFDEGVFGNYGWDNPVGADGLRAWDCNGVEIYRYNNSGDHFISDCYALNVVDDNEVWFYFYTDFELVCRKNGNVKYYQTEIAGSDGFVVYNQYVLFRGGYRKNNQYFLYEIKPAGLKLVNEVILLDENNQVLEGSYVDCKGSNMILLSGSKIYSIDLMRLLAEKRGTN